MTREETEACKVAHALVEAFAGESPVPTNHDYTPGNWLVGSDGQLVAIIDLEDMFYGFRIDPFVRLEAEYFPAMSLRTSFIAGYGTDLPTLQPEQMAVKLTILALGFLTAGIKGDERQRERGERVLEAARKFSEKY